MSLTVHLGKTPITPEMVAYLRQYVILAEVLGMQDVRRIRNMRKFLALYDKLAAGEVQA